MLRDSLRDLLSGDLRQRGGGIWEVTWYTIGGIEPALFGPSRDRGSGSCCFSGSQGQKGGDR